MFVSPSSFGDPDIIHRDGWTFDIAAAGAAIQSCDPSDKWPVLGWSIFNSSLNFKIVLKLTTA